jgi:hypothetical protein
MVNLAFFACFFALLKYIYCVDLSYDRLSRYCDQNITLREASFGQETLLKNWQLVHLTIHIRHGDRTSLHHSFPNALMSGRVNHLDELVSKYMEQFKSFVVADEV